MRFLYAMKIMEQETSWLDFYLSQIRLPLFLVVSHSKLSGKFRMR